MNNKQYHEKVKVDLQCPFCGHCKIIKLLPFRKAVKCPSCGQKVFLEYAGRFKAELDKHGNFFHAYEPFKLDNINDDFRGVFK